MAAINLTELLRKLRLEKPNASSTEFGREVHNRFFKEGGFIINDDPVTNHSADAAAYWAHVTNNMQDGLTEQAKRQAEYYKHIMNEMNNHRPWAEAVHDSIKEMNGSGNKAKRRAASRFTDHVHGRWIKTKPLPKQRFKPRGKWVAELHPLFKYNENGVDVVLYAEPGF